MSVKWSYRTLCLSYVLSFFAICISVQSLLSQATIPTLSLPDYESLQMADVYGQAYFSQSLASWSAQVEHYKGILRANWEAAADNAIFTYVDSITISDSFNDVDAYKDYVARELSSQKLEAMGTWEDQANLDFLENYNEFVSRLQTGRLNESYLSRLISQSELNSQNALAQDQNVLLNSINNARSQWEQMMSEQYYQGQYEFMTAKNEIEGKYQDVLSQLDAQEAIFNDNLQEINKYKKVVEGAISSMLTDFEGQLAEACTRSQDCAYRTANNGGLNNAGEKLQEFINKIRAKLNAPVTTTEFYLTDLSDALNTFLKGESSLADSNFIRHRNLTYTYQNTLDASSKTTSAYTFDIGSMIAEVNSGSFEFWRDKLGHVRWYSDNNYGTPQGGFSTELISYIFGRNETGIREFLNRTLRPQGREVEGNVYYNVYARDLGMANKIDPFTWTGIRHNDIDCDPNVHGPYCEYAFRGNWNQEGDDFKHFGLWRLGTLDTFFMDTVSYALVYTVRDDNEIAHRNYWDSVRTSMNRQISDYEMKIIPAIANWETQASNYSKAYAEWKVQANIAKAQAKVDYDAAMAELKANESRWMAKAREEYASGLASWEEMSQNVLQSETREQFELANKSISTQANTLFASNWQTGASQTVSSYSQTIASLTEREFTVTQTAQNPLNQIAEISTTNPGKKGLAPDAMDLGYTVRLDLGQSLSPNIGLSSVPKVPVARQTYSLFQANSQLKVETSVTEVDVASTFQKTSNGIYQYSQLLSMNENNDRSALFEQRRMINQNAYNIDWGARSVARFDDNGNLEGDARFKDILTILTDTKKSKPLIDSCMADTKKSYQDCFNKVHGQTLDRLIKIDGSLRFEDGMIVRSLTENESKLLGLSPIQDPKQPDARHGICYINPNDPECVALKLLRKDFDVDFNESTRVATFTKIISNGKIGGRNAKGEYISGTQAERRSMYLSSVDPVMAPKGKDLFDIWGNDDWKDVEAQNMAVNQTFYSRKLTADSKTIQSSVASILKVESENDAKFRKAKQDQEAQDSLIKDLIIAYISGGMAGVKGAIKSKVEDKINASLAEAWARASGADEDQISMLADAVSFLRGKVQEKKIKDRANSFSTNNPLRAIENSFAKVNSFANNVSGGLTGTMTGLMVSAGTTIVKTMAKATDSVFNAVGPGVAATINPMLTVTGKVMQSTSDYLDKQLPKMTGGKDAISAIRANEKGLIQKYATTALATSAGLPQEVASNIIGDYVGSQAAKKARRAVASNPLGNVASQIVGVAGGIIKTAAAGLGMKERDLQQVFSQGNRIANAGSLDSSTAEIQSEAMMNQMFGMKSSALSYTSSTPTLKDKNGFTKELFQREAVKQLSVGMSENERAILNSAFRANVSKREQSRADKKAQKEAARSTAITVITTAVSFGALSALGPLGSAIQSGINAVGNVVSAGINAVGGAISSLAPTLGSIASNVGSFLNVAAASAPQVGTAAIQTTVQVIDGSRNGPEGMLAGLANGVLSYFGKSGSFDLGDVTSSLGPKLGKFLSHSAVGVGVTYDKQNKWGAMIGLGSGSVNANISFSEKGNTTISGSAAPIPGMEKLQFTASTTTNGSTSIGVNVNAGKGPREGWNVGANYDINGGGLSGSIGYTDPNTGLGLTSTIDQYGLSTSAQLNGINLATNGPNGFVMEEINWAEQNINLAQDRTNRLQERANLIADGVPPAVAERIMNAQLNNETLSESDQALVNRAQERQILRDAGKSDEDINKMSPGERGDRVADLSKPRPYDPETIAVSAAASIGTFFAGAFAFAGGGNANNGGNQTPTNNPAVAERPVRMRKEEEGDSEVEVDRDGIRLDNNERPVSLVDATDRNPFSQFFVPDGYQNGFYDPRLDPDYRRPGQSDESEETINHVIDRNTRGIYKLSEEQLETYREKEKNLDKKLKASEPPIKSKTENLLASEENELTNLRKKRTELTEAFKQKMRNDIRNSSSDSPYKESADLAKVRKVYEAELAKLDKGIKSLNAKADIPFKTPVKPSDIVAEATSRTNYEKIMGLSKDEAIQRNRELTEERALKGKVDKDLQDQRSTIDGLNKAVKLLEEKQSSSKLSEAEKTRLGSEKKNLQETVERERQVYADKLAKQESVYKEAFEKKTRESKEIINKIYDDQIKIKETELESKKDSKEKTDIDRVKKLKAEIAQLETNKNTAIDSIDNKYKSSKVIVMDQPQDAIPDRYAKFHDPKALIDRHTKANLEFINEKLYSEDKPDFTMKDLPGNPPRKQLIIKDSNGLESGVIILGTESVNQHNDYGEKVVVISDRLEDIPAGHWDSDLGKYVYIQAGGNTCQSYTLLGQMVQEGVKFRDNSDMGRKLIHELTRLQYQMGETGNMSKDTINAYNRILDQFGLKARNIMDDKAIKTIEDKHNAIKEQLKKGKIVNSGMYLDAPPAEPKYNEKGEIKEPSQGHRVNIVGFDDERGEWIVNDSNRKDQLIRYPYGNYELGNRWSTVLEKK